MLNGLGRFSVLSQNVGEAPSIVKRSAPEFKHKTISAFGGLGSPSPGSATTGSSISTSSNVLRSVIDDFINVSDITAVRRIYHDIYYHDAVGGTAVDLLSTLPWSDFTITGLPDTEQLKAYSTTIENMHFKALFPQISVDYLVTGTFVGILNFDKTEKVFSSIAPQDIANCEINELPIYGMDPLIDVKINSTLLKLIQQAAKDTRLKGLMDQIPDFVVANAAKGKIELNPSNALYIPRRTFSTTSLGTSYFRRLLPLYILEKALLRGTIDSAYKRQKGILHIIMGDQDWEPNAQELSAVANMFVNAGLDPTGAIIATRDGVQTNELSSGESFWKHEDSEPSLTAQKMRALGINDSLFNSDSSYSTLEASLSVFIEQLRTYREMVTRKTLYDKIFPAIAVSNDFKKSRKEQLQTLGAYSNNGKFELVCDGKSLAPNIKYLGVDLTDYHMPKVHWHKSLKPEADDAYLAILATMEEKGVPVSLRQWAAAGGISITELMSSLGEDIDIRKKIKKDFVDKLPKTAQQEVQEMTAVFKGTGLKPRGLGSRKFEQETIRDADTGKVLSSKGRRVLTEKIHTNTARALSRIAQRENHKIKLERKPSKYYSTGTGVSPFGSV